MADQYCFSPIGVIRTPFHSPEGMPVQGSGAAGIVGRIEILPPFRESLADLSGFERIILIYVFHRIEGWSPVVIPYLDTTGRGLFATRAPRRPNPIGFSVVEVLSVEEEYIQVSGIDILDGTPLLDIKPYIPGFDAFPGSRAGWLEEAQHRARMTKADNRFHKEENY